MDPVFTTFYSTTINRLLHDKIFVELYFFFFNTLCYDVSDTLAQILTILPGYALVWVNSRNVSFNKSLYKWLNNNN